MSDAGTLLRIEELVKSLLSEDGVRDLFLSYNVGFELINLLEKNNERQDSKEAKEDCSKREDA